MRVVGVDTSSSIASVALLEDGRLVAERSYPDVSAGPSSFRSLPKSNHAESLLPLIASLNREARISPMDVSGIAVAIGPGSFTGLRVGLSTVKGLAYGWSVSVVGISTLLAQAARVGAFDGIVCTLLDARKNEVYAAWFRKRAQELSRLTPDLLVPLEVAVERARALIDGLPCLLIGDAVHRYEKPFVDALHGAARWCTEEVASTGAGAVARLGEARLRNSEADDLGILEPVYLRLSEAEAKRHKQSN